MVAKHISGLIFVKKLISAYETSLYRESTVLVQTTKLTSFPVYFSAFTGTHGIYPWRVGKLTYITVYISQCLNPSTDDYPSQY